MFSDGLSDDLFKSGLRYHASLWMSRGDSRQGACLAFDEFGSICGEHRRVATQGSEHF
jgi:hypothetical protein